MIITWCIIIITVLVSISAFRNSELFSRLRFNPYIIRETKQWYRFFSYGLLHADWAHLAINMFVLYSFGEQVELLMKYYFGVKGIFYYIILYVGGIVLSVVPSFEKHKNDSWYNAVGASGAVSAVLFSSIVFFPNSKIIFLFAGFTLPIKIYYVSTFWASVGVARDCNNVFLVFDYHDISCPTSFSVFYLYLHNG